MNCEQYRTLLDRTLDGEATQQELQQLREHEQTCPDCAQLRTLLEHIQQDLSALHDDVPSVPQDFHAAWTAAVAQEPRKAQHTGSFRYQMKRMAAVAAAVVLLIGGTVLTRGSLAPRTKQQATMATPTVQTSKAAGFTNDYSYDTVTMSRASLNGMETMSMDMEVALAADMVEMPAEEAAHENKIIRTASLTMATREFDAALAQLKDAATANGGWISACSESAGSNGLRRAYLTLRIPSTALDAYLATAGTAARVTNRNETSTDVTDSYYDTAARLATQQALMDRLYALVTDAASLNDLLKLESKIAETQYQIDRLTGSLKATDNQVNYATVDITLREETAAEIVTQSDLSLGERIVSALETAWHAVLAFLEDALIFIIVAIPAIIVIAVVMIVIVKKHKAKKPRT